MFNPADHSFKLALLRFSSQITGLRLRHSEKQQEQVAKCQSQPLLSRKKRKRTKTADLECFGSFELPGYKSHRFQQHHFDSKCTVTVLMVIILLRLALFILIFMNLFESSPEVFGQVLDASGTFNLFVRH